MEFLVFILVAALIFILLKIVGAILKTGIFLLIIPFKIGFILISAISIVAISSLYVLAGSLVLSIAVGIFLPLIIVGFGVFLLANK